MTSSDRALPPGRVGRDLAVSLAILRIVSGYSQSELAQIAGITSSAISDYERGKVDPQAQSLQKLLAALGLPHSVLDDAQDFILRVRALSNAHPEGRLDDPALSGGQAPREARTRRMEIAQIASDAGRFASRFVFFLLDLLDARRDPG